MNTPHKPEPNMSLGLNMVTASSIMIFLLAMSAFAFSLITYSKSQTNSTNVQGLNTTYRAARVASTGPILTSPDQTTIETLRASRHSSRTVQAQRDASTSNTTITASELTRMQKVIIGTSQIDGISLKVGDLILLKDEPSTESNGLYTVTQLLGSLAVYIRAPEMNTASKIVPGNSISVLEGTVNGGKAFSLFQNTGTDDNPVTGAGLTFRNTTADLLKTESSIPDGYVLASDSSEINKVKWVPKLGQARTGEGLANTTLTSSGTVALADLPGGSMIANATNTTATPIPLTMPRGSLLTKNNTGLIALAVGEPGQLLQSNGTDLSWEHVPGTGTVTYVTGGSGLTGGTIVESGTLAIANTLDEEGKYITPIVTINKHGQVTEVKEYESTPGQFLTAILEEDESLTHTTTVNGTVGQYLTFQGTGAAPAWTTLGTGAVTEVSAGTGLTGGPITNSGTLVLANTTVTPGAYKLTNLTVDAQGRLTAANSYNLPSGQVISSAAGTITNTTGGEAGQFLTSQGPNAVPTWTSITSEATFVSTGTGVALSNAGNLSLAEIPAHAVLANSTNSTGAPEPIELTRGSLLTVNASSMVALPVGAANAVLTSNGTDIAWTNNVQTKHISATERCVPPTSFANPVVGKMAYDTEEKSVKVYNGYVGAWRLLFYHPYYLKVKNGNYDESSVNITETYAPIPFTKLFENTAVHTTTITDGHTLSNLPAGIYTVSCVISAAQFDECGEIRLGFWNTLTAADEIVNYSSFRQREGPEYAYHSISLSGMVRIMPNTGYQFRARAFDPADGIYNTTYTHMSLLYIGK